MYKFNISAEGGLKRRGYNKFLKDSGLYKSLSLFLADRVKVPILPTQLVYELNMDDINRIAASWGLPIVFRLDYSSFPLQKPLGGVECSTIDSIVRGCKNLMDAGLYPLLHPSVDRFRNRYSIGVLCSQDSEDVIMEVVGEGFDAGDLRRGTSVPHETIKFSLASDEIISRDVIDPDLYRLERLRRMDRMDAFVRYRRSVDQAGLFSDILPEREGSESHSTPYEKAIPEFYRPMSRPAMREVMGHVFRVWSGVIPELPNSDMFVASFSQVPSYGWVLWDVYGKWYLR